MTDKILEAVKALGGDISNTWNYKGDESLLALCDDGDYICVYDEDEILSDAKYICTVSEFNTYAAEWLKEAYMHNAAIDCKWNSHQMVGVTGNIYHNSMRICTKQEFIYCATNKLQSQVETPEEKEAFDMIDAKRKVPSEKMKRALDEVKEIESRQKVEWDGEGLPPIGVECEVIYKYGNNFNITPTYFGDGVMAYIDHRDMEEKVSGSTDIMTFRPIQSPRDKAIDELSDLIVNAAQPTSYPKKHAEYYSTRIYDWLKSLTPEQKKEFGL